MTDCIKTEVSRLGEVLHALQGAVLSTEEACFPDIEPPPWVHVVGLLTKLALIEYDSLEVKARPGIGAGYER